MHIGLAHRLGSTKMDMLAHCRAMATFCRQRATFENENDSFWIREAEELENLISEYAPPAAPAAVGRVKEVGWRMRSLGK
jgi:hypothetical protein